MRERISAAASRAARDVAYLAVGLATSLVAAGTWVAGVSIVVSLAVFIVGIPAIAACAVAFRWVADLDRRNAARILGAPLRGHYGDHGGRGMLARVKATVLDAQTWRDLAWLVAHSVVGTTFGSLALIAPLTVVGFAVLPAWYWALPEGADLGLFTVDRLPEAIVTAPLAVPLAVLTVSLLRAMALAEARLAAALLGPPAGATTEAPAGRQRGAPPALLETVPLHAALAAAVGLVCTLLWGLTHRGYFWPVWIWLGLAISVALHAVAVRAVRAGGDAERRFRVRVELCAVIAAVCVAVWALAGGGYLWPVWPVLGMGSALAVRGLFVFRHRLPWVRERALVERVDELTRTRRGALDVQAAELRRIERDLHDGAQARLVSLSMLMGRAEERLADQPEVAALVRQAREEAGAAIGELRDLARGIAPPVLADRGLAAALEALATRAPMPVTVSAPDRERPPPVVETAAYFVVAEALTNVAKHAGGAGAHVSVSRRGGRLVVEVTDDGPGGAEPAGSGLTGLRHRVEALDGVVRIDSPAGAGTTIRAELPCGS